MFQRLIILTLAVAALAAAAPQAGAQITTYDNLAAYNAAATTNSLFTFEIAPPSGSVINPELSPLAVTVSGGADRNYYVYDGESTDGNYSLNGTDSLLAGYSELTLPTTTIAFDDLVTAFATEIGFRYGGSEPNLNSFTARLFNGAVAVGPSFTSSSIFGTQAFATGFFGVTSTLPFDRIAVTQSKTPDASYLTYDNLRIGAALPTAAVPEADTFALALPALSMIGAVIVRRRRK